MSGSNQVKITNKRTGEVSSAQTARSAMQRKEEKPSASKSTGREKTEGERIQKGANANAQESVGVEPAERPSGSQTSAKKKKAKLEINSLADFIVYAYSRKGQNLKSLAPGEVKAITRNAKLTEREFEDLLNMSKGDALLAVPRQVFLAVQELDGPPLIRKEVRRLVSEVLKQHPVYQHNDLAPVIANLPGASEPVEAFRTIARLGQDTLANLAGLEQPKPKDAETLRSNAINCLALWLWESRGPPGVNRVIRWLHDGYWSMVAPPDMAESAALHVVTGITEIPAAGLLCMLFKAEANESTQRAAALQRKIEGIRNDMDGLRQTVGDLQEEIRKRDDAMTRLAKDLEAERSAHANSRAHLGDDREHLRSNVVRRLRREVSLLTEGLQALRKDPPKIHVMDDHAERVLEGLQAAMNELEE